jgi:hypothetical protein
VTEHIPRRKLDAVRALSTAKPSLVGELLDDILAEHPKEPKSPISDWYGRPRLAVLGDGGTPTARGSDVASLDDKSVTPTAQSSETADDYPRVVAVLDSETRVIAADIQWIVQRRRKGRAVWDNRYFCRTKEGLLLYAGRTKPDVAPPPPPPELLALPDRFPA